MREDKYCDECINLIQDRCPDLGERGGCRHFQPTIYFECYSNLHSLYNLKLVDRGVVFWSYTINPSRMLELGLEI